MIYGIDIGGTKMELAVFDSQMARHFAHRAATPTDNYDEFIASISALVTLADEQFQSDAPIGLGVPGLVDAAGRSLCSNVPCAMGRRIAKDLAATLKRPFVTDNDCRLFALSEAHGGAGAGHSLVVGIILGTGMAGGVAVDGRLINGRQNIAGEFGHQPISAVLQQQYELPLFKCGCGLTACYETYVSGQGIMNLVRHFEGRWSNPPELLAAYETGDRVARRVFDCYLDILGSCLAGIVMQLDPDILVLGGGLSRFSGFVNALPPHVQRHLFPNFDVPPIVAARFGDASGVRGAAILAQGAGAV